LADILVQHIENEKWSDLKESLYENIKFNNLINLKYKAQEKILVPVSLI
jgi:hypothetical protein